MTVQYDLTSAEYYADPYPTYARMRREDPVYWDPGMGIWFVTRYSDVLSLMRDRCWSSDRVAHFFTGLGPELADDIAVVSRFYTDWLVFLDPPNHTRLRRLMTRAFSPRGIETIREFTRTAVDQALDRVAGAGRFDAIADFSVPVPAQVIAHMLGVAPQDVEQFKGWTTDVFRVPAWVGDQGENVRVASRSVRALEEYFRALIAERRRHPTDDLLGMLVAADADGHILTDQELVSTCALLLVAGHETTTNQIGNAVLALLRHPAELARLRADPTLLDSAVEEFLRYDGSPGGLARVARHDTELAGQTILAGQIAMGMAQAANRDPAVFADPDRFDVGRADNRHLGLGLGPHICLGAALARLELRIAVGVLIERFPRLTLETDNLTWLHSLAERGLTSLPVTI
jgi:cytochrome P450